MDATTRMRQQPGPAPGTTSEIWDGSLASGEDIARWARPHCVHLVWAGQEGWQLWYRVRPNAPRIRMEWGNRLAVVNGDGYVEVGRCYGDQHVTPHRECILR